jgi:hypothetical protein
MQFLDWFNDEAQERAAEINKSLYGNSDKSNEEEDC